MAGKVHSESRLAMHPVWTLLPEFPSQAFLFTANSICLEKSLLFCRLIEGSMATKLRCRSPTSDVSGTFCQRGGVYGRGGLCHVHSTPESYRRDTCLSQRHFWWLWQDQGLIQARHNLGKEKNAHPVVMQGLESHGGG